MPASYCLKSTSSPAPSLTSCADLRRSAAISALMAFASVTDVPGVGHLVGEVGVGAHDRGDRLVQLDALGLVGLEMLGVAGIRGAEVVLVLQRVLWRCDRLAEGADDLQRLVEVLAGLVEPVGQQALDVLLLVAVERAAV